MCLLVWLLQNAWRAWGYTGTHMGCKLHVVASRPICGVRLWLIACHGDGEGEEREDEKKEKASCPGCLGNTRHAEFAVCCFADSFLCLHA